MSAVDRWAWRDAVRIHNRVLQVLREGVVEPDEAAYLAAQARFVLMTTGDLPTGWASDLWELIELLDGFEGTVYENEAA